MHNKKYSKSTKYKNVYIDEIVSGKAGMNAKLLAFPQFRSDITIRGNRMLARHKTEKDAAIFVDLKRIEHGLEPVNILKRK